MKRTNRNRLLQAHKCPVDGCGASIPNRSVFCQDDWRLVPHELRDRLVKALQYGLAWKCHPTDEFLEARREALRLVNEERARRAAPPPLFAST